MNIETERKHSSNRDNEYDGTYKDSVSEESLGCALEVLFARVKTGCDTTLTVV